ncbi:MAG TPA: hypothetical protein VN865_06675 [Candidatus Acidoferrales bacterium]|jgi:hypothetical protein|nr:hypothetical protein [Candidatus Acidoferrales bacterium]
MKAILAMTIVALFSTALAGCWFYSRPDTSTGCQKTTYGVVTATSSNENCPPPAPDAPTAQVPLTAPPIPPPATP